MDTIAIDLKDPKFLEDPYPYFQQLRETSPVYWLPFAVPSPNGILGMWLVTRYSDVAAVLTSERLTKKATRVLPQTPTGGPIENDLLSTDPPDHTRLRGLVNLVFTPKKIRDLEPRIQSIIEDLLRQVRQKQHMDFIADFALPLPVFVIAELLGVPVEDRAQFREWTTLMLNSMDAVNQNEEKIKKGMEAGQSLIGYFMNLVQQRRSTPQDDLISALVHVHDGGDRLSEKELLGMCQLLLIAGHETTVNLLGNGLFSLLTHPDQFERLKKHPEFLDSAIEEMLRFESPVQRSTPRFTLEPFTVAGFTIEPGQQVSAVIGSANRDPLQFPDPDSFDITRTPNRHVAFGRGIHFCLGAPLARTEARLAFRKLLSEMPGLELADSRPVWNGNTFIRGLKSLNVTW